MRKCICCTQSGVCGTNTNLLQLNNCQVHLKYKTSDHGCHNSMQRFLRMAAST